MICNGHVYTAVSVDGFIARLDGDIDWLNKNASNTGEDYGFNSFMASVDGLVMGRKSYEKVLTFGGWPYKKLVVVLSRTLTQKDVPEHLAGRVRVSDFTPHQIMQSLYDEGWRNAYIDGGQIVQSFLRSDLIQSMTLTRVPTLLGAGIPFFGMHNHDIDLKHLQTRSFPSGFVQSKYNINKTR